MKLVMFKGGEERGHAMQCELLSQDHTPGLRPSPLGPVVLCAFRTKALETARVGLDSNPACY